MCEAGGWVRDGLWGGDDGVDSAVGAMLIKT